mgnify:CR=1 FL=1
MLYLDGDASTFLNHKDGIGRTGGGECSCKTETKPQVIYQRETATQKCENMGTWHVIQLDNDHIRVK